MYNSSLQKSRKVKQNRYTVKNLIVRIVLSFIDQNGILSSMSICVGGNTSLQVQCVLCVLQVSVWKNRVSGSRW